MKKFQGTKKMDDIIKDAVEQKWEVDTDLFHQSGSDFIYLRDQKVRMKQVALNVTNGCFSVFEPFSNEPTATHLSSGLDDEPWYQELLELIYEPLKEVPKTNA